MAAEVESAGLPRIETWEMLKKELKSNSFQATRHGWQGRAATVEAKRQCKDVCQGVYFLDAQYRQYGRRRQVAIFHKRAEVVGAKRVEKAECPNSLLFSAIAMANGLATTLRKIHIPSSRTK